MTAIGTPSTETTQVLVVQRPAGKKVLSGGGFGILYTGGPSGLFDQAASVHASFPLNDNNWDLQVSLEAVDGFVPGTTWHINDFAVCA